MTSGLKIIPFKNGCRPKPSLSNVKSFAASVHRGVTTQDIMDTGMILQTREALSVINEQSKRILKQLQRLATEHQGTQMIGRTNGQHAAPITFGFKLEVWLAELKRRRAAIECAARRGLMVQFGGPVGNLKDFDADIGGKLKVVIARSRDLEICDPHWQNARDGVQDIIISIGALCVSVEKIAHNVNLLSSSDIAELREEGVPGKGASSSMSHKQNQRCSEFAHAIASMGRQRANDIQVSSLHEHERSGGAWIAEWLIIPQCFLLCSGSLMWMERLFNSLMVEAERMKININ